MLDQKFASLEQLYFRFFDARKAVSEPLPPNLHVTRQRLQVLKRGGPGDLAEGVLGAEVPVPA